MEDTIKQREESKVVATNNTGEDNSLPVEVTLKVMFYAPK